MLQTLNLSNTQYNKSWVALVGGKCSSVNHTHKTNSLEHGWSATLSSGLWLVWDSGIVLLGGGSVSEKAHPKDMISETDMRGGSENLLEWESVSYGPHPAQVTQVAPVTKKKQTFCGKTRC